MQTLNKTLGTDQEIKDLFEICNTNANHGIKCEMLRKAAKLVTVEDKQITCKDLLDLRTLMNKLMPEHHLTTQIKTLFYLGHVSTVIK